MKNLNLHSEIFLTMKDERSVKEKLSGKEEFKNIPKFIWEFEDRIYRNLGSKKDKLLFSLELSEVLDPSKKYDHLLPKLLIWIVSKTAPHADGKGKAAIGKVLEVLNDWDRTGKVDEVKAKKARDDAWAALTTSTFPVRSQSPKTAKTC